MSNFNLGSSKSFGDGHNVIQGNVGANFWGHNILKFDGSLEDKAKLLKVVKNYVRLLTGVNIPVSYSSQGLDQSYTDGKTITISSIIVPESLDSTIGLGLHEASHIAQTDFDILRLLMSKKLLPKKYHKDILIIKNLFNWIEDRRIDWWAIHKSPGYAKYYEELYGRYFYSSKVTKILNIKQNNVEEKIENYLFYIINSLHPNVTMTELKGLPEIEKIIDLDNVGRWNNTQETLDVAIKIYDVIMKYIDIDKDEEQDEENGNCKGTKSGKSSVLNTDSDLEEIPDNCDSDNTSDVKDGKENENTKKERDDLEEVSNDKEPEGENDTSDDIGDELVPEEINDEEEFGEDDDFSSEEDLTDAIKEALEGQEAFLDGKPIDDVGDEIKVCIEEREATLLEDFLREDKTIEKVQKNENNTLDNQSFDVITVNKVSINDIRSNKYIIFVSEPQEKNKPFIDRGFSLGTMLGKKLKKRNDKKSLRTVKLKKGKIDKRNLHSAGAGSENIFYTLKEDKYNDISIHISVDVSGSMDGKEWQNTLVAIIAISKASSMVKGIRVQLSFRYSNFEINSKNLSDFRAVVINFYDSIKDNISKLKQLIYLIPNGGTPEGVCFEALKQDIMKPLMNKDTLFINFSDGMPGMVGMRPADGIRITKNVIKSFKNVGMTILSYFISGNGIINESTKKAFIDMYGLDAEFIDVNSLPKLAKTINNKLLKLGH